MDNVIMTYAGEIYARFDKGSSALWNLVNGRQSAAVNEVVLGENAPANNAVNIQTAYLGRWVELPFSQTYDDITAHSTYTSGKSITNGIVNLEFDLPQQLSADTDYTLHVSYNYNAVLTFSQGTCDYVI